MSTRVKAGVFLFVFLLVGFVFMHTSDAAARGEEYLVRIHVEQAGHETVDVSVPASIFSTIFKTMPREVLEALEDIDMSPERLIAELTKTKGNDLVQVKGKEENVTIRVEPVSEINREEADFIKVHVEDGGEDGHIVNVCIPKGLVELASEIVVKLGLAEQIFPREMIEAISHARR